MSEGNGAVIGREHQLGVGKLIELSPAAEKKIAELIGKYPQKKSAVMPALYIAQEELGWVTPEAVEWVANRLSLPTAHVYEVASFYTMYYKRPVAKYHVQVCRTLSCHILGARAIVDKLESRFKIKAGEITEDGMWSFEEVECLGSCGTGPMCQINDRFFENLTPGRMEDLVLKIGAEQPELRYSTVKEELGRGLTSEPCSRILPDSQ